MAQVSWPLPRSLSPTPPQARDWLSQELRRSEYQDPWLTSLIRWVLDQGRKILDGTGSLAGLSPVITGLVALVVIALLVWVLPRVRRESGVAHPRWAVLDDPTTSARTYRDRAAQALAEGRFDDTVLDGFRAIAKGMSDRTLLEDAPGRTAHEVSLALAPPFPEHADRLARAADMFDSVRYGLHRANADQAARIQQLDAELLTTRPMLAASPFQSSPV